MVASVGHKEHRLLLTIVEHLHGQRNVMIIIIENGINAGMLWDKLVDACTSTSMYKYYKHFQSKWCAHIYIV